jgi:hypothetical protein
MKRNSTTQQEAEEAPEESDPGFRPKDELTISKSLEKSHVFPDHDEDDNATRLEELTLEKNK